MELSEMELERIAAGKQPRATYPVTIPRALPLVVASTRVASAPQTPATRAGCTGGVCGG